MVDRIKELCKQNKTSIAKLERELGIGNGVIARWKKASPRIENLQAVANALGVSVAYLTGESEQKEKPATPKGDELTEAKIKLLFSKMSVEELWAVIADAQDEIKGRSTHG